MKKFLIAVLFIIVLPALVLTYFALKSDKEKTGYSTSFPDKGSRSESVAPSMEHMLYSPLQKLRVNIDQDDNGTLFFSVSDAGGLVLLNQSRIGINTDECDFSQGLSFVSQSPAKIIDVKYTNISGKRSTSRNYYSETVLNFEKEEYLFDVYLRAYEDGFAYRFGIRSKDGTKAELHVVSETGTFAIPAGSGITAETIDSLSKKICYENTYSTHSVESLSENQSQYVCFPALAAVADENGDKSGKYLLFSEADMISGSYRGSVLGTQGNNVFGIEHAPVAGDTPTVITTEFLSPWRFGIYGEAGDIAMSDMAENLSPSSQGDYSWVEPGVTAWTWL